jgi:sugar phosphate isomerase/epimerase
MDFTPIVAALKRADYRGWVSIFMHEEIKLAQHYLADCLARV